MSNTKKTRILQLDPAHFRELDGVVFDLESFARHCAPHPKKIAEPLPAPQAVSDPKPVSEPPKQQAAFAYEPVHVGWYPIEVKGTPYPIMANANMIFGTSSGSSSYLTSFLTSWQTISGSYLSSGSFYSSYSSSGVLSCAGGYGLELI